MNQVKPRIIHLDGRYNLSNFFKYRIEWTSGWYGYSAQQERLIQYQLVRQWLTENFGHGCEENIYTGLPPAIRPEWVWGVNDRKCLYITEKMLTAYTLYSETLLAKTEQFTQE
jgi:hypothetical protein